MSQLRTDRRAADTDLVSCQSKQNCEWTSSCLTSDIIDRRAVEADSVSCQRKCAWASTDASTVGGLTSCWHWSCQLSKQTICEWTSRDVPSQNRVNRPKSYWHWLCQLSKQIKCEWTSRDVPTRNKPKLLTLTLSVVKAKWADIDEMSQLRTDRRAVDTDSVSCPYKCS